MKKYLLIILVFASCNLFAQKQLVEYVNTLQGTDSKFELSWGNTFPATALPFAVHMWSPQTGINGDGWKYQYSKDSIRGFQQAHQCSPWTGDYAVFTLMPVAGKLAVDQYSRAASFKHADEIARPDLYKVKLGNGITTEMSTTERGVHFRFAFPKKQDAFIVLDGYNKNSMVQIIPEENKIVGYVNNQRFAPSNFVNYFVIVFDKPITFYGTWENVKNNIRNNNKIDSGAGIGAYIQFAKGVTVQAKVASSYISAAQAELNLQKELGKHTSIEQTIAASAAIWNKVLGNVKVDGATEEDKATFYSCLYRSSLFSRQFYEYDSDNRPYYFSPYDGKVHYGYMYTDNGFWDTFRSELPLHNLLYPEMQGRYMQAMLDAQQQCGWLPSWSFPSETGGMLGNHTI